MTARLLVTGGAGFIGAALALQARARGMAVRVSSRRDLGPSAAGLEYCTVAGLDGATDWRAALYDVDTVVHCAARVHVMRETAGIPLAAFRTTNLAGTMQLARQAATAGVRRFVFLSSIGVNGAGTSGTPFTAFDVAAPHSPYAQSKYEAELALMDLSRACGMEVVIVRPPLVYGPDAPGNFGLLTRAVRGGMWLPLGAVHNRRSFVGRDNLADFILACVAHPDAAGRTLLVSDGEDVSTTDLLRRMARQGAVSSRLVPVPVGLLRLLGKAAGKADAVQSLAGDLQVDSAWSRQLLGWAPPLSLDEGLRRALGA